jgi:hypothetical protein
LLNESSYEANAANIQPMDTSAQVDEGDDEDGNGVALSEAAVRFWYGGGSGPNNPGGPEEFGNPRDTLNGQINDGTSITPSDENGDYIGQTYTIDNCPSNCNIQWLRNGQPISGATSASYTTTVDDIGAKISSLCCGKETEGFEAGTGSLPPPPAGTNPDVRVYWIASNVFCLSGVCTESVQIFGFVTISYASYAAGAVTIDMDLLDPSGCIENIGCVGAPPCNFNNVCLTTRWNLRLKINGTLFNSYISSYLGANNGPGKERVVGVYAP